MSVAIAAMPIELISAAMNVSSEKIDVVVVEREAREELAVARPASGVFSDSDAIHATGISA